MAAKIGNARNARLALTMFANGTIGRKESPFKLLGSGSIRKAYLHKPTKVVYKVEYMPTGEGEWRHGYSNEAEYMNVRRLEKMLYPDRWWSTRVRIPLVSIFSVGDASVIAMEYVNGERGSYAENVHYNFIKELKAIGIGDMHGANWMVDKEGTVWPIDLGCNWNGPSPVFYDAW